MFRQPNPSCISLFLLSNKLQKQHVFRTQATNKRIEGQNTKYRYNIKNTVTMMFPSLLNFLFANMEEKQGILNEQSVKEMQSHPLSEMGKSTRSKLFEEVVQDDDLFRLMKQQLRRSPQRPLTNDGLAEMLHEPEFLKNLAEVAMEANRVKRERAAAESHAKSLLVEDKEEDESTDIEYHQQEGAGTMRSGSLQSQRNAQYRNTGYNSRMMTSQQRPIYTVVEKRENAILPALRKASVVIERGRQLVVKGTQVSMHNLVNVSCRDDDNNCKSSQTLPSLIVSPQQQQHDGFTPTRRCQTTSERSFALRRRSLPRRSNQIWNFDKPASKNDCSSTSSPTEEMDGAFAKPRFNQGFLDLTSPLVRAEHAGGR
jgi:hypothetical protein